MKPLLRDRLNAAVSPPDRLPRARRSPIIPTVSTTPRLIVCTEVFPPRIFGSSVLLWNLLRATSPEVEYLVLTSSPGDSATGIVTVGKDLPAFLYRRDLKVGLSDFIRIFSVKFLFRKFLRIAREFRPDAVVSVFPSDRFAAMGHRLSSALGVPHAVYFHNLWEEVFRHAAVDPGFASDRYRLRLAREWEGVIVRACSSRYAVTEPMARFLSEKHGVPFLHVPHTFLPAPQEFTGQDDLGKRNVLDLLLTGSVYGMHVSSLRPLIELIGGRDDVRLTITTGQSREYLASMDVYGSPNVEVEYFPGEDSFARRMQAADGCVVCLAWEGHSPEDVSVALPTRTVEALRFGKPLFVVAPEDSFLFRFVRKEEVGIAVSPGAPEEISAAMDTFLDPVRRDGFARNARCLFDGMFSTRHVGPLWVGLVRNLAGGAVQPVRNTMKRANHHVE